MNSHAKTLLVSPFSNTQTRASWLMFPSPVIFSVDVPLKLVDQFTRPCLGLLAAPGSCKLANE